MAVKWPSNGRQMAVKWPSNGRQMAVKWPSNGRALYHHIWPIDNGFDIYINC
jgi:hypothetical protein